MQTVEENKINYLVFPSNEFDTGSLPEGDKSYILFAYQSMQNNSGSYTYTSASADSNDRWRTVPVTITSGTPSTGQLSLQAGTTYEIQLRYGIEPQVTWIEVTSNWGETSRVWSAEPFNPAEQIILETDRVFVSGSVSPTGSVYISSNEDAQLTIYQG